MKASNILLNLALFIIGIFLLFQPPADPDFGWHYRYGEYIFKNHQLLRENVFSYTFADYEWANSYWIAQVILYVLYEFTGPIGMSLILSALLAGTVVFTLHIVKINNFGKVVTLILFFIFAGLSYTTVRPLFFSTLFMFLLSYILLYKPKWQLGLIGLFMIWANTHADFTLGLFVYTIFTANNLFKIYKNKNLISTNTLKVVAIPVLSVLVTCVNPYKFKLWETLLKETHYFQFMHISEWLPLSPLSTDFVSTTLVIAFAALFCASAASAYLVKKEQFGLWYVSICVFFFLLSFRSVYFLRVLTTLSVIPLAFFCNFTGETLHTRLSTNIKKVYKPTIIIFISMLLLVCAEYFVKNLELASSTETWATKKEYPYHAVKYLKENNVQGNIFNLYGWGGYLIWHLPEYKTFIDGRMPSWRTANYSLFEDYIKITHEPAQNINLFKEYQKRYDIRWVLDRTNSELVKELVENNKWQVIKEYDSYILIEQTF